MLFLSHLKTSFKWAAAMGAFALAVAVVPAPSSASLADDIEKANEESSGGSAEPQSELDIANADLNEITEQLKALNTQVTQSGATKKKLDAEREFLKEQSGNYDSDIGDIQAKIDTLETELSGRALEAFKSRGGQSLFSGADPSDSLRKRRLSSSVVKNEIETAEELRQAKADLAAKEVAQDDLAEKLDREATENSNNLQKYESARNSLVKVAEEAEERAQRTLSEAEGLEGLDKAKADELRKSVAALGEQIRIALSERVKQEQAEAKANPSKEYVPDGTFPTEADIEDVGNGIKVHKDIAAQVKVMLADAEAEGITLRGGGFRSNASQIAIRKNNCGTSSYAIYQMPSSSCRPPTARPGKSMHEQGRAIDFTNGAGATITRGSPEYIWLTNNAANYNLKNFPRESWHWSTNGK